MKKTEKTGNNGNNLLGILKILGMIIEADIPDSKNDIAEMLRDMGIPERNINIMENFRKNFQHYGTPSEENY